MQSSTIGPVAPQERIQTIDIIRGFALFGILVINFTVDDGDGGFYDKFNGFADQVVYWTIRVFLDDRFQTIYCFLFGLGFALQMQRAAERNKSFVFAYLRRMIALYIISTSVFILIGEGYNVLPYYAMVGILLLLFWKVPAKFLPLLAIFFFLLPLTRNTVVRVNTELKIESVSKKNITVDTTILDKYVGVYKMDPGERQIIIRNGDTLIGEGPGRRYVLTALSDSQFIRKDINWTITFVKDLSENTYRQIGKAPNGTIIKGIKIQTDLQQALKEQLELRNRNRNPDKHLSYAEFVDKNATGYRNYIKNWKWKNFIDQYLWRNNYKIGYILVLFLLGMYAGKRKIFYNVEANRGFLKKVFKWGLIVGGAGLLFYLCFQAWNYYNYHGWAKYSALEWLAFSSPWDLGIICMAMAYVAGITLLVQNNKWKKRLSFFATVGRMGLTNYILHLFAYILIFDKVNWFWGLEGKIGNLYRLLLAIPVYILLYFFSRWWLSHFKYGPFEWLWRSLTYLKFQPMRLNKETNNV